MNSLEKTNCDFCKSYESKLVLSAKDWINRIDGDYCIVKCNKCGLLYTNPRPTPITIDRYYPDDTSYYVPQVNDFESLHFKKHHNYLSLFLNYPPKRKLINKNISKIKYVLYTRINTKRRGIPEFVKNGLLLDIGCSYGSFLSEMNYLGWRTVGVDTNKTAVSYGKERLGLDIKNCTIEEFSPKEKFDVVSMRMVLEHVFSPSTILKKITELLKPNGTLVITIPSYGLEAKIFKDYAYTLHLPNHITHFTPSIITKYLKQNGFTNIKIYSQVNFTDIYKPLDYMIENGRKVKWIKTIVTNRIIKKIILGPLLELLAHLKLTSRMTIYAKFN